MLPKRRSTGGVPASATGLVFGYRRLASGPRIGTPADQLRRTGTGRNDRGRFALAVMTHIIFSDYRNTAAEEAYEIAWDFLTRAGAIRNEFEACVFLAQRIAVMVDQGQTNRIRMPSAMARPSPREEPVTSAVRPERSNRAVLISKFLRRWSGAR